MTLEEALEYLNLPASPRKQLVRKRYLELKRDYLKAIYNAPSDHFCTLYQENLEKIEEAYLLLSTHPAHEQQDAELQQKIEEIQKLIDSVHKSSSLLNAKSKHAIKGYIYQIERLQNQLRTEDTTEPPGLSLPSSKWETRQSLNEDQSVGTPPTWKWEIKRPGKAVKRKEKPANTIAGSTEYPLPANESALSGNNWLTRFSDKLDQAATTGTRKQFFSQFLLGVIIAVVILSAIGLLYILFPLLFQD